MGDLDVVAVAEGDYVIQLGRRTGTWPGGRFRGVDIGPGDYVRGRLHVPLRRQEHRRTVGRPRRPRDDPGGRIVSRQSTSGPNAERERHMSGKGAHNLPTHHTLRGY